MAEMSKAYTPEFMGDPNPREKILKLARKITDSSTIRFWASR